MKITERTQRGFEIALTVASIASILLSFLQFRKETELRKLQIKYFETQLK